jgi:hypothetical protein
MEKKKQPKTGKAPKAGIDKLYREIEKDDLKNANGGLGRLRAQFSE